MSTDTTFATDQPAASTDTPDLGDAAAEALFAPSAVQGLLALDVATSGATAGTTQWRAERFQVFNWGGFIGLATLDFAVTDQPAGGAGTPAGNGSTLLTGASGSGKSSLLDAWLALMMPADTAFNGASNDAVTGRARSKEQRNLISYLRGQVDTVPDPRTGADVPEVLRGDGAPTWGAVAMTFVNDNGERFTVLRAYYVPAGDEGRYTMRMATLEGPLDLRDLKAVATNRFKPTELKASFGAGLRSWDSYDSFRAHFASRLGIGANGDPAKALKLLARVQAGQQIKSVDLLFKQMVLDEPTTFAAADKALEDFDYLEQNYLQMQEAKDKVDLLAPLTDLHERCTAAAATRQLLEEIGAVIPPAVAAARVTSTGSSAGSTAGAQSRTRLVPVTLWQARTEVELLTAAIAANKTLRERCKQDLKRVAAKQVALNSQVEAAAADVEANGGAQLRTLEARVAELGRRLSELTERRATLLAHLTRLGLTVTLASQLEYDAARSDADAYTVWARQREDELGLASTELNVRQIRLGDRKKELREDLESLGSRAGRVDRHMDERRRQVAQAVGMAPAELPYLAELIDLAPDQTRWRLAAETVLAASARLMLVPEHALARFSAAIDGLSLRGKLDFEAVPDTVPRRPGAGNADDPDRLAGKLLYADHRYADWVRAHVAQDSRNALCVDGPGGLSGPGLRVTEAGQTRRGQRGSHGRNATQNIIGFSSEDLRVELEAELAGIEARLRTEVDGPRTQIRTELEGLQATSRAYEALAVVPWADIDVPTAVADLAEAERAVADLEAASGSLAQLRERHRQLKDTYDVAVKEVGDLEKRGEQLHAAWLKLLEDEDASKDVLDAAEAAGITLEPEHAAYLDEAFAEARAGRDVDTLAEFQDACVSLAVELRRRHTYAGHEIDDVQAQMCRIFAQYRTRWHDPNLSEDIEAYPDYARILADLQATGLHHQREQWRRALVKWSGEDLLPLSSAFDADVRAIEARLVPINAILEKLPFGAGQDRLRIVRRLSTSAQVQAFRSELRKLATLATGDLPEEAMAPHFERLRAFMHRLRPAGDPRAVGDREALLDVNRLVFITAERYAPGDPGTTLSTHSTLGGKSGGESQELIAFIVGAALRFRLGDQENARPRFAPVFLDEGFVKSDGRFTGRAVSAWKGLGFQLVVAAPEEKCASLEPHMTKIIGVTKNIDTHQSFVHEFTDAERRAHAAPDAPGQAR
ncbi:MAG: ATP-binding protein [Motilibacteraceae bacterium]